MRRWAIGNCIFGIKWLTKAKYGLGYSIFNKQMLLNFINWRQSFDSQKTFEREFLVAEYDRWRKQQAHTNVIRWRIVFDLGICLTWINFIHHM